MLGLFPVSSPFLLAWLDSFCGEPQSTFTGTLPGGKLFESIANGIYTGLIETARKHGYVAPISLLPGGSRSPSFPVSANSLISYSLLTCHTDGGEKVWQTLMTHLPLQVALSTIIVPGTLTYSGPIDQLPLAQRPGGRGWGV